MVVSARSLMLGGRLPPGEYLTEQGAVSTAFPERYQYAIPIRTSGFAGGAATPAQQAAVSSASIAEQKRQQQQKAQAATEISGLQAEQARLESQAGAIASENASLANLRADILKRQKSMVQQSAPYTNKLVAEYNVRAGQLEKQQASYGVARADLGRRLQSSAQIIQGAGMQLPEVKVPEVRVQVSTVKQFATPEQQGLVFRGGYREPSQLIPEEAEMREAYFIGKSRGIKIPVEQQYSWERIEAARQQEIGLIATGTIMPFVGIGGLSTYAASGLTGLASYGLAMGGGTIAGEAIRAKSPEVLATILPGKAAGTYEIGAEGLGLAGFILGAKALSAGISIAKMAKANAFIRENLTMPKSLELSLKNKIPPDKELEKLARTINPRKGMQITMPKIKGLPDIETMPMPTIKELQKEAINLPPKKAPFKIITSERAKLPSIVGKIPPDKELEKLARTINPRKGMQITMPKIKGLPDLIKPPAISDLKKFARELSNIQAEKKATEKAMKTFTSLTPEEKITLKRITFPGGYNFQATQQIQLEKPYTIIPTIKTGYLPFDAYVGKYANQFANWKEPAKAKAGIQQGLLFDISGEQKLNIYISNLPQQNAIGQFAKTRQKTPMEKELDRSVGGGIKLGTYTGTQLIPKLAYAMGIKTPQDEKQRQKEMLGISIKPKEMPSISTKSIMGISTKIIPQQRQKINFRQSQAQFESQLQKMLPRMATQTMQRQLIITTATTKEKARQKPPILKLPPLLPSFGGFSPKKAQKLLPGFFPIIRRAGKEIALTKFPVSKEAARAIAIANVIGSPQASYKLLAGGPARKAKAPKLPAGIGRMFRPAKTLPGFFVEKAKYRIDMPGEYAGITMKGLATLASPFYRKSRSRKAGWLF